MLVLTRKVRQKVHIGPDIVVTVVKIDGNKIRLGIEAPSNVAIFREEISPDGIPLEGAATLSCG